MTEGSHGIVPVWRFEIFEIQVWQIRFLAGLWAHYNIVVLTYLLTYLLTYPEPRFSDRSIWGYWFSGSSVPEISGFAAGKHNLKERGQMKAGCGVGQTI